MRRLEEMSQTEISGLDFESTVVLLPLSPLEEHGPHLPVGVDLFLSEALGLKLGESIERTWPSIRVVTCPLLPLGAQVVPGPGSVSTRQRALHDTLFDFVRSLARTGFQYVVFCTAHGGLGHLIVLEEVADRSRRELGMRVEPALSRLVIPFFTGAYRPAIEERMGRKLTDEERSALRCDVHGGQWETGAMLLVRPDLVDSSYRDLPPVNFPGWLQLRSRMRESCAQGLGYVGSPGFTSEEYASAAWAVLEEKVLEQIDRMLHRPRFRPSHTPFYYLPGLRTRPTYSGRTLARAAGTAFAAGAVLGIGAGMFGSWLRRFTRPG